jgi:hypothetical protein
MAEPIPADEQSNYETFRDCLSEPILKLLAAPLDKANSKKRRNVKKSSKEKNGMTAREAKITVSHRDAQASDAEDLGDFIEVQHLIAPPSTPR